MNDGVGSCPRRQVATAEYEGMLQRTPPSRICVATEPVDCRKGLDGRAAVCRRVLGDNPLNGALYVCRNRSGTTYNIWCYDGQGFGLGTTRLSQGRFTWWSSAYAARYRLAARALVLRLWHGPPEQASMAAAWRQLA